MSTTDRAPVVFIVDDDDAVRTSLGLLLKAHHIKSVAYASAADLLAAHDPQLPGCALVDIRMPGMSGLELQEELNRRGAIVPVIFITGHGDVPMVVQAMRQGAFDFLQKPFREEDLLPRIERAIARDRENRQLLREQDQIRTRFESLTPRERQVLKLVTGGQPNKVMAAELGVSQRTVEIHRAHLMEKMGASSLAHLVRMEMSLGSSQ